MMYPRLELLKEFLREDGVILISIDDNEFSALRMLMDEIYGSENFIATMVWEKTRKNDAKFISLGHEYMLVFAKSLKKLKEVKTVWREAKPGAKEIIDYYKQLREKYGNIYKRIEEALQQWYQDLPKNHPSKKLSRYKHIDKWGPWRDRDISWPGGGGPRYDVIHPKTKKPCKVPDAGWRFSTPESMQRQIALGLIEFRPDHTEPPIRKAHLVIVPEEYFDEAEMMDQEDTDLDDESIGLQVMPSVVYKQSQVAVKYLRKLMGSKVFDNPKDHEVLARIFRYCTNGDPDALIS